MSVSPSTAESVRIFPDDWLNPMPLEQYFVPGRPLEVDVGCGKGRFLLARAAACPDVNFLGIDRMLGRLRRIDRKIIRRELDNVRLLRLDAYYAVAYMLPPQSVSTYYVFFPDPWPKKRHISHRLFSPIFTDALFRTMSPDGILHVATDHWPYFEEIRDQLREDSRFAEIPPFEPCDEQRTDFELLYLDKKPIGRFSCRKVQSK